MLHIFIRLITNLSVTLLFEVPLAWCFGVREKQKLAVVTLINCATNPVVNFTLSLIPFFGIYAYSLGILFVLEILSFLIEGMVYRCFSIKHAFLLSFILNFASFFGGQLFHRML